MQNFQIVGRVHSIQVSGAGRANTQASADAEGGDNKGQGARPSGPSAVLFIQYGPRREPTHRQVEFINAVNVRVPGAKWPTLAEKIQEGALVEITGRIQGVYRRPSERASDAAAARLVSASPKAMTEVELVAERVTVIGAGDAPYADTAAEGK